MSIHYLLLSLVTTRIYKESLLKLSVSDESFNGGSSGEVLVKAEAINCCRRDKKWSSFSVF